MMKNETKKQTFDRSAGVLMSISSLPSDYGIGTMGKAAYEFADFVRACNHKYWQVLPIGSTTYGDSPYQSYSAFAGNPYFIDLDMLAEDGLLLKSDMLAVDWGDGKVPVHISEEEAGNGNFTQNTDIGLGNECYVSYEKMYQNRFAVLRKAFESYKAVRSESRVKLAAGLPEYKKYDNFIRDNADWIENYALFMAVKDRFDGVAWNEWAEDIRLRWSNAMDYYRRELYYEIEFYSYLQFVFMKQWKKLKNYANINGIEIIGDIPIYVAFDGADTWASPELFQFDEENNPVAVAGCPPDDFSATGQLWGNPLYNWDYHKKTGYDWWIKRIRHCFKLYDVVRIDHFRGFDEYYSIPYGDKTAVNGSWKKGPGMDLFHTIEKKIGRKSVIAEDLGYITDTVRKLVADSGFMGTKVLEFAFDTRDTGSAREYLPHNYIENCVAYTGTHDNETLVGWWQEVDDEGRKKARDYLCDYYTPADKMYIPLIGVIMRSNAKICIVPIQDYLGLDNKSRMNTPSSVGSNWRWRVDSKELNKTLAKEIKAITVRYERCN